MEENKQTKPTLEQKLEVYKKIVKSLGRMSCMVKKEEIETTNK
ncbi:MAG: hypothetical protein WC389_01540 [Lutibacter sp.]|jgi:hypothetical protein